MPAKPTAPRPRRKSADKPNASKAKAQPTLSQRRLAILLVTLVAVLGVSVAMTIAYPVRKPPEQRAEREHTGVRSAAQRKPSPRPAPVYDWLVCWETWPQQVANADVTRTSYSNIAKNDYVKPATCERCHPQQFQQWSQHPHAKMNATASQHTVTGRFDGSSVSMDGGVATMFQRDGSSWMRLEKGDVWREYRVTRTIGSRFFQYYAGVHERGTPLRVKILTPHEGWAEMPARPNDDHTYPAEDLVLPFGFWMKKQQWIPVYDVFAFMDDESLANPEAFDVFDNFQPKPYYRNCGLCHTTQAEDHRLLWDYTSTYLNKPTAHVNLWAMLDDAYKSSGNSPQPRLKGDWLFDVVGAHLDNYDAEQAVTLGISCEACHYGGREHATTKGNPPPRFVPSSPHVSVPQRHIDDLGRNAININHTCGRCHSAYRHRLPGGEMHKNSAECVDAFRGACYSQLKCTHCHDPHQATGQVWPKTPQQDDRSCVVCHDQFQDAAQVAKHTHHPLDSAGSRCMNCHMPKVVEGLQDVVRTHRIDSPTRQSVLAGGGMNACNTCHLRETIDWTVDHLEEWYDRRLDRTEFEAVYGSARQRPVGEAWLDHPDRHVRLSAMGSVKQQSATWLLPSLARELDSPRLINRHFAQDTIETVLDTDLDAAAGYQFWLSGEDRSQAVQRVQSWLRSRK